MANGLCSKCAKQLVLGDCAPSVLKRGYGYCNTCIVDIQQKRLSLDYVKRRKGLDLIKRQIYEINAINKAARLEYNRRRGLKKYGITLEQWYRILEKQNNVCAVCGKPERAKTRYGKILTLTTDHCHKTNKIRGILCQACNRAIGLFLDNPETCLSAAVYLQAGVPDATKSCLG